VNLETKLIDLTLARFIPGAPEQVFDVWFDPDSPGGPWHGAKKVLMNLAVDGMFYFGITRAEARSKSPALEDGGALVGHFGRFTAIERPRLAEHTWMSEHTRGVETTVSVTFEPDEAGTQMTIVHRGVPDDDLGRTHERGWIFLLTRVAHSFEKTRERE
jgi:uncharacterized protein YndB with AHSA1/START domain